MQLQEVPEVPLCVESKPATQNLELIEFSPGARAAYYLSLAALIIGPAINAPDLKTAAASAIGAESVVAVIDHFRRNGMGIVPSLQKLIR